MARFCGLVVLLCSLALVHAQQSTSDKIAAQYGGADQAATLRSAIPRFYGPSKMDPVAVKDGTFDASGYAVGIGLLAVPGIFFAIMTLIISSIYWVCRCICLCPCCSCCSCCQTDPKGYDAPQRWHSFYGLFGLVIVAGAFACMGLYYNESLDEAWVGTGAGGKTKGITNLVGGLFDDTLSYTDKVNRTTQGISEATGPVVQRVTGLLDQTGILREGTYGFLTRLDDFARIFNGRSITIISPNTTYVQDMTFACSYCTTVSQQVQTTSDQARTAADPQFASLNDTTNAIRKNLIDVQNTVQNGFKEASNQIGAAQDQIKRFRGDVDNYMDKIKEYETDRRIGGIALFTFILVLGVLVLAGGLLKRFGLPFLLVAIGSVIAGFICWFLFGVHLPIAMVTGDSCLVIEYAQQRMVEFNKDVGKVFDACLTNSSIIVAFNLTDKLEFANKINFGNVPDVSQFLNFSAYNTLYQDIMRLDSSTFTGFNNTEITNNIYVINAYTKQWEDPHFDYTRLNLSRVPDFDSRAPSYQLQYDIASKKYTALQMIAASDAIDGLLSEIKGNMTALNSFYEDMKNKTNTVQHDLNNARTFLDPLIAAGRKVYDLDSCYFLGSAYAGVKTQYCEKTVTALTFLSLATFVVSLMLMPGCCLAHTLHRRFPNHKPDSPEGGEGGEGGEENGTNSGKGKQQQQDEVHADSVQPFQAPQPASDHVYVPPPFAAPPPIDENHDIALPQIPNQQPPPPPPLDPSTQDPPGYLATPK